MDSLVICPSRTLGGAGVWAGLGGYSLFLSEEVKIIWVHLSGARGQGEQSS